MNRPSARTPFLLILTLLLAGGVCAPGAAARLPGYPAGAPDSYPPDPTADIPWSGGMSGVADIQAAFNNGRAVESSQLGISIPPLTLPSQPAWNAMTDSEKALWLVNRERVDRGVAPLDAVESNVTEVAQYYAQFLLDNNAFGHEADGRTPWQRLEANPAIGGCYDFLEVAENLAAFMTSGGSIDLPVERAVYNWTYDDADSAWGHRHANLWYPYDDNGGTPGQEGFLGIGRAEGPYQGWNYGSVIVMNVFDPCAGWPYDDHGWTSLGKPDGVTLNGRPVMGRTSDNRQEMFILGSDYALWHAWQVAPNSSWSGWYSLGRPAGVTLGSIAFGSNQDGGMEVFANGSDGAIWHIWQGWSDWESMGTAGMWMGAPAAGKNADGRQEIFATNVDGALYQTWQNAPNDGWAGYWAGMGRPAEAGLFEPIAVGWNQSGGMDVFAHGADGAIYHRWQTAPSNGWVDGWHGLGKPAVDYLADPVAGQNADGRQELFAIGSDGRVWHRRQTAPNGGWAGWESLGQPAGTSVYHPYLAKTTDGQLYVFVQGSDNVVWYRFQMAANGNWSPDWDSLSKPSGVSLGAPAVGRDENGQFVVVAGGSDGAVWATTLRPAWPIIVFPVVYLPVVDKRR